MRERSIRETFSEGRDLLAEKQVGAGEKLTPAVERAIIEELKTQLGKAIPVNILPVLLRQYFDPVLERQILKVVGAVLRDGGVIFDARGSERTGGL